MNEIIEKAKKKMDEEIKKGKEEKIEEKIIEKESEAKKLKEILEL
jgi:hypothetical protein